MIACDEVVGARLTNGRNCAMFEAVCRSFRITSPREQWQTASLVSNSLNNSQNVWIMSLASSATYRLPMASMDKWNVVFMTAEVAGPPSPE